MKKTKINFLLFFLLAFVLKAFPATETKNIRLGNGALVTNAQVTVQDEKYLIGPSWWNNYNYLQHEAQIKFGLDETKHKTYLNHNISATIHLHVVAYNVYGAPTNLNYLVGITYGPNGTYYDKDVIKLNGYAKIVVTVTGITCNDNTLSLPMTPPAELYLEAQVTATRFYKFPSPTYIPTSNSGYFNYHIITKPCATLGSCVSELEVFWPYFTGAEEYELEWTWVNDYPGAPLAYDFRTDATRITTMNNHYNIPVLYEKGYILIRMRGIGHNGPNITDRVEGYWTGTGTVLDFGTVASYPGNLKYHILPGEQQTADYMNWSASLTFAEDGKKGTGISYADGMLMPRQSQAKLNSAEKIIAQETLYDYQGRPAVTILPAPIAVNYFNFTTLNLDGSYSEYTKDDFDQDISCVSGAQPMNVVSSGAANYYSSSNPDQSGAQGYVPDAKQYPFVQVEYTADKTGKLLTQSLPGDAHKIGGGHETKYFYSNPSDAELKRLFGSDAGNAGHYDKDIVMDANGQLSTTYKDMSGKVVATALMGAKPAALDPIADYTSTENLVDNLILFNKTDNNNYTITSSKDIFVETPGSVQTFDYEFTPQDFSDPTCAPSKCFDCIYEVEFRITDNCNQPVTTPISVVVGAMVNSSNVGTCDSPANVVFQLSPTPISVTFPNVGTYHVTKILRVSNIPITQYVAEYLSSGNTCIKTLAQIVTDQTSAIDFSSCGSDCIACSTSVVNYVSAHPGALTTQQISDLHDHCSELCSAFDPCEASRQAMLTDFYPGGQYADYVGSPGPYTSSTDPTSIFSSGNALGVMFNGVSYPSSMWAQVPGPNGMVATDPAGMTPADYIKYYRNEWATLFLNYHPEKPYLDFCAANKTSDQYDYDMLQVNSYDEACAKGFLRPLTGGPSISGCTTTHYDPFFDTGGEGLNANNEIADQAFTDVYGNTTAGFSGRGYTYKNFMLYAFNSHYPISSNPVNSATNPTIYNFAKTLAGNTALGFGADPCTKDDEWMHFRELYLNYKLRIVAQRKTDYVMTATPPVVGGSMGFNGCMINSGLNNPTDPFTPSYDNWSVTDAHITSPSIFTGPTTTNPNLISLNFLPFVFTPITPQVHGAAFYTFMGYPISKTPNGKDVAACAGATNYYNPWGEDLTSCTSNTGGDNKQPCSIARTNNFTGKTARWPQMAFDITTLINNYTTSSSPPPNNIMPSVAAVGPPPTSAISTNYCNDVCASYADELITQLKGCNVSLDPDPNDLGFSFASPDPAATAFIGGPYSALKADLINVCTRGCDGTNPYGASSVSPGNTSTGLTPLHFNNFSQVINYYATANGWTIGPDCDPDLISMPKPYGSNVSGTAANPSQLDTCGCDKVLSAQYFFLQKQAANTLPTGVTTAEQYFNYVYGNDLSGFSELECKCETAWNTSSPLTNWYNATQVSHTNWTSTQQGNLTSSGVTYVPAFLDCGKPCLPCSTVVNAITNYNSANPSYVTDANYSILLTNHLNNLFDFNLSYDDYMNFYNDCLYNPPTSCPQYAVMTKLKALINEWIAFYCNDPTCISTTSPFTNGSGPTGLPDLFNTTGTPDFLTCRPPYTGPTTGGTVGPPAVPLNLFTYFGNGVSFNGLTDAVNGETCGSCQLVIDVLGLNPPYTVLPQITALSFSVIPLNIAISSTSYHYNFSFEIDNLGYGGLGYFSCLPTIVPCTNPAVLCDKPAPSAAIVDDCATTLINNAYNNAVNLYNNQIAAATDNFIKRYKDKCLAVPDEKFDRTYDLNEYNYTLYYYDQAGNLVRTVPPKGVNKLVPANYNTVPAHKYVTNYSYQSYNAPLTSQSADETGATNYVYDNVGRIVASCNAKQLAATGGPFASYTIYDALGRIIEVGEVNKTLSAIQSAVAANTSIKAISGGVYTQVVATHYDDPHPLAVFTFPGTQENLRNRVSYTTFEDQDDFVLNTYKYATHYSYDEHGNVKQLQQVNLPLSAYGHYGFLMEYDYDLVSGNVNTVSFQKGMTDQFFHKYEYDDDNRLHLVMTSKDGVSWERDAKYFYYDHGPLARKELGEQKVHAEDFAYTIQGWIKSVNSNMLDPTADVGKDGDVSAYSTAVSNIHNFIGRDAFGYNLNYYGLSTLKDYTAIKDANFNTSTDKNMIGGTSNINTATTPFDLQLDAPDLFNGNISSMVTSIIDKDPTNNMTDNAPFPQIAGYRYDQLHRITQMKAFRDFDYTNNQWNNNTTYDQSYESTFAYDKNGNITSLNRNGAATTLASSLGNNMDQLSYIYNDNGGSIITNKLIGVADAISGAPYTTDIQGGSSAAVGSPGTFDYDYDEIGNLIKNTKEYIAEIKWTVDRKVAAIIRNPGPMFAAGKNLPDIYYEYDANRQRVVKVEKPILNNGTTYPYLKENNWKTTYYVRDASGNIMATYSTKFTLSSGTVYNYVISADEFDLYGAGRLGTRPAGFLPATIGTGAYDNSTNVYTPNTAPGPVNMPSFGWIHQAGTASYELSNHLGNVLTVISDRKVGVDNNADNIFDWYLADITETHDYYPFGYDMPGRTYGTGYRTGHNGQEREHSTFEGAYSAEFWMYDARLGRRWEQDPITKPWESPYAAFANSPIYLSDPFGLDGKDPKEAKSGAKDGAGTKYSNNDNTRTNGSTKQTFNDQCNCYISDNIMAASEGKFSAAEESSKTSPEAMHQAQVMLNMIQDIIAHQTQAENDYINQAPGLYKLVGGGFPNRIYEEAEQARQQDIYNYYHGTNEIVAASYYDPDAGTTYLANGGLQTPLFDPIDIFSSWVAITRGAETAIVKEFAEDVAQSAASVSSKETGQFCVYQLVDEAGTVKYVGITKQDYLKRFAQHRASDPAKALLEPQVLEVFGKTLTKNQARAIEQILIDNFGLQKNGGQLLNKINSIRK